MLRHHTPVTSTTASIAAPRTAIVALRAALIATAALLLVWNEAGAQQAPLRITLGDAARMAAERSATTAAARARSSQADARVAQHRADLLPSLTSSTQLGARTYNTASLGLEVPGAPGEPPLFDPRGEVMGPVHTVDFRTQMTQRLVDLPAVFRWRGSAASAEAARHDAEAAAEASAERGALAYLRVLRAEARIAARTADSALASELLDIARQQLNAGIGIALDVTRAESQLADARARLIRTRSERDRAALELRRELAMSETAALSIADSLELPADAAQTISADEAVRDALRRRADFKAAQAESESARLNARAASAGRLPTISFFADNGYNGKNTDDLLSTYTYGVQVTTPVFDGLRVRSKAAEERARQREVDAELQNSRRQIETEVRTALISAAAAREEVEAARARLLLAEQEVAQATERFRQGVSGNADVINASIALNGARDLVIDALTAFHGARVAVASARAMTTTLR